MKPRIMDSLIHKLILASLIMIGMGFIAPNIAASIITGYKISQTPISSMENVTKFSGLTFFLISFILLIILGISLIIWATQFNIDKVPPLRITILSIQFASIYLLFLSIGSLVCSEAKAGLAPFISSVLIMIGTGIYISKSPIIRVASSCIGAIGGILLAYSEFQFSPFQLAFSWDLPYPGLFLSLPVVEAVAIVIVSIEIAVFTICSEIVELEEEFKIYNVVVIDLVAIAGIIYAVGIIGSSLRLSLSILNFLWKAPWSPPFYGLPQWMLNVIMYWAASTIVLIIGAVLLIAASCLELFKKLSEAPNFSL